jgi:hypothetical protein
MINCLSCQYEVDDMERQITKDLQRCWEDGTGHPNALTALRATKDFWPYWAQWQKVLAREAIANGATWDEIGRAMGTSRQAAWGRFKADVEGVEPMQKESERQIRDAIKEAKACGHERNQALTEERRRLRDDLRALDKKRTQERTELQQQIKILQGRLRDLRCQHTDSQ